MKTLLHLCRKDFTHAWPWVVGTWLAFVLESMAFRSGFVFGGDNTPSSILLFNIPCALIFLATAVIARCDSAFETTAFMGTRPVSRSALLVSKLASIAVFVILPPVFLTLINAALMRLDLSALDFLLLGAEKGLHYSIFAALALLATSFTRSFGTTVLIAIASAVSTAWLLGPLLVKARGWQLDTSWDAKHLAASAWLASQALLVVMIVAITAVRLLVRRTWISAGAGLFCVVLLVSASRIWPWNFVDHLTRDSSARNSGAANAKIEWLGEPEFGAGMIINGVTTIRLNRFARLTGLRNGWQARFSEFQSEARFPDGTAWTSARASELYPQLDPASVVLPQAGIDLPDDDPMQSLHTRQGWNLFECDESRLQRLSKRNAALSGQAKFAISKPVILRELPAEVGATAVIGRNEYRVEHIDVVTRGIAIRVTVRGIELKSARDISASLPAMNLLLVNPRTKEFVCTRGIGGRRGSHRTSLMGMKQTTIDVEFEPDPRAPARFPANPRDFLNGARLFIIGNFYGGTITRTYEIPEILLEESR